MLLSIEFMILKKDYHVITFCFIYIFTQYHNFFRIGLQIIKQSLQEFALLQSEVNTISNTHEICVKLQFCLVAVISPQNCLTVIVFCEIHQTGCERQMFYMKMKVNLPCNIRVQYKWKTTDIFPLQNTPGEMQRKRRITHSDRGCCVHI